MFGSKKKLEATGKTAYATVTKARPSVSTGMGQNEAGVGGERTWIIHVTVHPEGEETFDAKISKKVVWNQVVTPGETMSVVYDPNDHSKVEADQSRAGQMSSGIEMAAGFLADKPGAAGSADIAALLKQQMANPGADPSALAAALGGTVVGADAAPVAAPPAAPTSDDPVAKLTQLADLRDRGVLSSDEFEAQKNRILGETS
jgi:hypothetical protein